MHTLQTVVSGISGDFLVYSGPAKPAFFVPASRMPAVLQSAAAPSPLAITSDVALAILGSLVYRVEALRSVQPPAEAFNECAFAARTGAGWIFAYADCPNEPLYNWAESLGIHIVVTPTDSWITAHGLTRIASKKDRTLMRKVWDRIYDRHGRGSVSITPDAWQSARNAIHEVLERMHAVAKQPAEVALRNNIPMHVLPPSIFGEN